MVAFWLVEVLFFLFATSPVCAQDVPSVYVTDVILTSSVVSSGDAVSGSFSVWNTESSLVTGISYRVILKDESATLDESDILGELTLSADERKNLSYSYTLPSNMGTGDYKLGIYLVAGKDGLPVGWGDVDLSVTGDGGLLRVSDPRIVVGGEGYHSGTGLSFEVAQPFSFRFKAQNPLSYAVSAVPKVEIYACETTGERVGEKTEDTIFFSPRMEKTLEYTSFFPSVPGAYLAKVQFYDSSGEILSNALFFRFVITGLGAKVHTVMLDSDSYYKGEVAEAMVNYSGPADSQTVGGIADLHLKFWDRDDKICGQVEKSINLEEERVLVEVPLSCDVSFPRIEVKIIKDGDILDVYEAAGSGVRPGVDFSLENEVCENPVVWGLVLLLAIVLTMIVGCILWQRKRIGGSILVCFVFGYGLLGLLRPALAAEVVYKQAESGDDIGVTWNTPIRDDELSAGSVIDFEGAVYIPASHGAFLDCTIEFYLTSKPVGECPTDCPSEDCEEGVCVREEVLESELSQQIKTGILESGTVVKLGEVSAEDGVSYHESLAIPEDLPLQLMGEIYAMVYFRGYHNDVQHTLIAKERVQVVTEGLLGYVWEDANSNGVRDFGENTTGAAEIRLDDADDGDVLDPEGFSVEVEEGEHRVYIKPEDCWCVTYFNTCESAEWGGRPCSGITYGGLSGMGTEWPYVWWPDPLGVGEVGYAYSGIQRALFSLELPTGPLVADPDEESRRINVEVKKDGDCWNPVDAQVVLEASVTTIDGLPTDGLVEVGSIEIANDDPPVPNYQAWIDLDIEGGATYADGYKLCVRGTGNLACLGSVEACVEFVVERAAWIQTEVGDVYAAGGINSYIPSEDDALPFRNEERFTDLGLHYNYFSMPRTSSGFILSRTVVNLGDGSLAPGVGWETEDYTVGFYNEADFGSYVYDFGYFDANFNADCELDGNAVMENGAITLATDSSKLCLVVDNNVIRVEGDLDVLDSLGFENNRAAILVDGTIRFEGTWEMTETRPEPDVMLVMDRSGSMGGSWGTKTKIRAAKDALNAFVGEADPDYDRIGLATYSSSAGLDIGLTTNFGSVTSKINSFSARGYTSIGSGMEVANTELIDNGRGEDYPKYMVLATDGLQNTPPRPYDGLVSVAQSNNITIFTVGIGSDAASTLLQRIADDTGGAYYYADDPTSLEDIYEQIAALITEIETTGGFAPQGGSYAFIAGEDIEIGGGVRSIRALLVADGTIYDYSVDEVDSLEEQRNGLWMQGTVCGFGYESPGGDPVGEGLALRRTRDGRDGIPDNLDDDFEASNYFSLDPELLVDLTPILGVSRFRWR